MRKLSIKEIIKFKGKSEKSRKTFASNLKAELAMFTDILYRYLKKNFSEKHSINPNYCIAVDVVNGTDVNYNQILNNEIISELDSTIEEIEKLM